jgi:cysteine desulfurase/selenocysteine lyase
VLGTVNPVAELAGVARSHGVLSVVDGSQAVPHLPVDVSALGVDFYAWTGHKAYGPTGIGVLHGRRALLEELDPLLGGGHMIQRVTKQGSTWAEPPARFEAGTSAIAESVGLGAAADFLLGLGMENVWAHEQEVLPYLRSRLAEVDGITLHGPSDAAVVSFSLDWAHPHDVAEILGRDGVCVRAGHHCAQVLMGVLGTHATTRASVSVHTTRQDVDALVEGLDAVRRIFG